MPFFTSYDRLILSTTLFDKESLLANKISRLIENIKSSYTQEVGEQVVKMKCIDYKINDIAFTQ